MSSNIEIIRHGLSLSHVIVDEELYIGNISGANVANVGNMKTFIMSRWTVHLWSSLCIYKSKSPRLQKREGAAAYLSESLCLIEYEA
jgi:hypothetical protein